MVFSRASVKYRPLRVGFIVREGHIEDIIKASGINSLLWGGIFNPIIPVATGKNIFARQMIDLFSVDILYPIVETLEIKEFINEYPLLKNPSHYAENIFYEDWDTKKKVLGLLDVKNAIDLFWRHEYKNKSKTYKSNFTLVNWEQSDPLASMLAVQFGFFPKDISLKLNFEEIFLKGLRARKLNLSPDNPLLSHPRRTLGPIDVTCAELRGYATGRTNGDGVYIGDSNDFFDLLSFWNIRATGADIVYLAKDHLERNLSFAKAFLDFLNGLPNKRPDVEDRITIYCRSDDTKLRETLLKILKSKKSISWHNITEHSWNGMNLNPYCQIFEWKSITTHIETVYDKYTINIELPEKKFLVDEDNFDLSHQLLAVAISPYDDFNYPGYTLQLPRIRELNEFYSREILSIDSRSLRVEKDGFSKIISAHDYSINLHPISKQMLLEKIFEIAGIKARISQPGLIAKKIIEKIDGLEDARVLKIKGVRKILQKGAPDTVITRGDAVKTIFENNFDKHKHLFIEARESPELDANSVFDYLLKKEFFRAGLELICTQCNLTNWLSLKAVDDIWTCEYCGSKNQTSIHLRHRGDWKFRKSGLFAKDNHQEGAITTLLSLLAIKRIFDTSDFTYSTALELRGDKIDDCETDLCIVQNSHNNRIEIAIGECKSDGGLITKDDCVKLRKVAKELMNFKANITVYIIFAKTCDAFSDEEIDLFEELSKEIGLIILSNNELEPYHIYWLDDGGIEDDIPEKYPLTLSDLSKNSHIRYLKKM